MCTGLQGKVDINLEVGFHTMVSDLCHGCNNFVFYLVITDQSFPACAQNVEETVYEADAVLDGRSGHQTKVEC